jgi:hypothetical protein
MPDGIRAAFTRTESAKKNLQLRAAVRAGRKSCTFAGFLA